MDKPKFVFIINSIQQQRCIKRVEEFIERGYDVDAYGFSRSEIVPTQPRKYQIKIVGTFSDSLSYSKRMLLMYKSLCPVFEKHKGQNVIYYYFLLDVALICRFISKQAYIYEESDLMQTYLPTSLFRSFFNFLDRRIIKKSVMTVMTSEGFIHFHFKDKRIDNVCLIPNRLPASITQVPVLKKRQLNMDNLQIAFVGAARYSTILNFALIIGNSFPQHDFHFYGIIDPEFEELKSYANIYFHGPFVNPLDLPQIYSNIDMVIATYDTKYENVRYAEPNKLYEALYFETPIIVSRNTYLSQKVKGLDIGFSVDASNNNEIIDFIQKLTKEDIGQKQNACKLIEKKSCFNINDGFFKKLKNYIELHKLH